MKDFEYASPRSETAVLELLSREPGHTEILAGGTDLVGLMRKMIVTPERVVNIKEVASLRGIAGDSTGVTIGATTTLDDMLAAPELADYAAITQAIAGINSPQLQSQGTLGGELCQRPRCWYFRGGQGLLGNRGRLPTDGDNRFHAIFGNSGAARFVSSSRLAPALIALGALVRVIGPGPEDEAIFPVEDLFRTPRDESQRENTLGAGQLLTHVLLPPMAGQVSATYEVRASAGPDYPLAAAAAVLTIELGVVRAARVVLGQVAPTPWNSPAAAQAILGQMVTYDSAAAAGLAAVASATPMSDNEYKVQLAKVATQRAIMSAAGLDLGGF
jgi:xanthine dehydrogenase YagS FAD-binding subunit